MFSAQHRKSLKNKTSKEDTDMLEGGITFFESKLLKT